ncbi:hypothetical protein [Saccharolobus shibatae]|nr:hypothetical protein [Saccharolobus shibatae]
MEARKRKVRQFIETKYLLMILLVAGLFIYLWYFDAANFKSCK